MGEVLSIDEIERRYPDHWILLTDVYDNPDTGMVGGGVVYAAGPDRDEIYDKAMAIPGSGRLAFRCTQKPPPDMVFVL